MLCVWGVFKQGRKIGQCSLQFLLGGDCDFKDNLLEVICLGVMVTWKNKLCCREMATGKEVL